MKTQLIGFGAMMLCLTSAAVQAQSSDEWPHDPLTIGVALFEPSVMEGEGGYYGFDVELWEHMADYMKIPRGAYTYKAYPFDELMHAIERGEVDMAMAGITITPERERVMDFSHAYKDSGLAVLERDEDVSSIMLFSHIAGAVLTSSLFWGALAVVLVASVLFWWTDQGKDGIDDRPWPGLFDAFYFSIVTATTVGYGDVTAKTIRARLTVLTLMFFLLTGAGTVLSAVSSFDIDDVRGSVVESASDFRGLNIATVSGTTSERAAERLGAKVTPASGISGAYALLHKKQVDAVVFDEPALAYYARHNGAGMARVTARLHQEAYGFAFPEGSDLREQVNRALLTLQHNGVYKNVHQSYFGALD